MHNDFVRHGAVLFVSTSLVNIFSYVFHFAISRRVGVERYGTVSALNAALMISSIVPQIVATVVVKYAATFRAVDDRSHLAALTRTLVRYAIGGALLAGLLLVALSGSIAAFLKIDDRAAVVLAMIIVGLSTATGSLRGIFLGIEDFNGFSISIVLESGLKMFLGIGLVSAGLGVEGAFGGWAVGSASALLYTVIALLRSVDGVIGVPVTVDLRRLATTMAGVAAATFLFISMSNVDVIAVKHYADPTTAGLYGALALSGKILFFLVGFVPLIVLPKATRQALSGARPTAVLLQALGAIAGLSGAGLIFYRLWPARVVTALAGAAFAPAAPYVFAYGFAMVVLAVLNVVLMYKVAIHRFDFVLPLVVCALAQVVGFALYHRTLADVIAVLIATNLCAALLSSWRIAAPLGRRVPLAAEGVA